MHFSQYSQLQHIITYFRIMAAVKQQSSLSQQAGMQAVDLTKLNLMQLTQFKQGLDTDLQFYQESLQNLKLAQSK